MLASAPKLLWKLHFCVHKSNVLCTYMNYDALDFWPCDKSQLKCQHSPFLFIVVVLARQDKVANMTPLQWYFTICKCKFYWFHISSFFETWHIYGWTMTKICRNCDIHSLEIKSFHVANFGIGGLIMTIYCAIKEHKLASWRLSALSIMAYWCYMTLYILVNFGPGNGLSPVWCQAITRTNADSLDLWKETEVKMKTFVQQNA